VLCGGFVELFVLESFGEPGCVEAEVDADVAVLVEAGVVKFGAETEDTDSGGLELPEGIERDGFVLGIDVVLGVGFGIDGGVVGVGFGGPEVPAHLELVGHVVVKLFGGLGDGSFDDGGGGILVFFGAVVVDVDALVGGSFGEADRVDGGGCDALFSTNKGELAHDRDEGRG